MFDFLVPFIDVIVKNQFSLLFRKEFQAFKEAIVLRAVGIDDRQVRGSYVCSNLPSSISLHGDEAGDAKEITGGLAHVSFANFG
jgi:hypothetical protein